MRQIGSTKRPGILNQINQRIEYRQPSKANTFILSTNPNDKIRNTVTFIYILRSRFVPIGTKAFSWQKVSIFLITKNKECYSRLPVCALNLRHLLTSTRFQIRNAFSTFQSPWKAGYLSPLQIFLVGRRPIVNTLGSSSHGPKAFHTKKSVGIF